MRSSVRDDLFVSVFGHPPPKIPIDSYVLVVVDGGAQQKVKAVVSTAEQTLLLEGKTTLALLSPVLRAERTQRLNRRVDAEGWLSRGALEEAGVLCSFDRRKFEVRLQISPELRETLTRYLDVPAINPLTVDAIRPAAAAAFLNLDVRSTERAQTAGNVATHQSGVAFATDGAVNLRGVVFEGSAFGQTGSQRTFERGDLRLVYDRPRQAWRFTAGDLNYPVVGYQTNVSIGGIGFAKDFSLQPYVRTYRTGQFEFYLERPAEVKMWVNDSLVRTLQLPAGAHDIRGLTPAVGQNDLRLEVEDSAGRRELLHFAFIFNPVLLDKGRNVFSYNAGFLRTAQNDTYRYDPKQPVVSASYLEGWTDDTTVGAYAQAKPTAALFGGKVLHLLPVGTLQLDTATSRAPGAKWDLAARLELTHSPVSGVAGVQTQVYLEYLGRHFTSLAAGRPAPSDGLNFGAALAAPLGRNVTGQLSGFYAAARSAGKVGVYGGAATLSRRWSSATSGSVSLRRRRSGLGQTVNELLVGLTVAFSWRRSNFYAAKELETNTVAARWDSVRPSNGTAPYGFASARAGSSGQEYQLGTGYWGNQGLAEASFRRVATDLSTGGRLALDEAALRLQGALVFADGRFALARSVIENFAIVEGKAGLANVDMKIDPDVAGGSRARSNWLSPAVLGDLANYRVREVRIEPINPPLGAAPERLTYSLAPTYKSGFLLQLGRELRIVMVGRLLDEEARPLANLQIEIRRADEKGSPLTTFTGRSGGFQVPDVKPGRYEIRAAASPYRGRASVEIPDSRDGLYRVGDLVLRL